MLSAFHAAMCVREFRPNFDSSETRIKRLKDFRVNVPKLSGLLFNIKKKVINKHLIGLKTEIETITWRGKFLR